MPTIAGRRLHTKKIVYIVHFSLESGLSVDYIRTWSLRVREHPNPKPLYKGRGASGAECCAKSGLFESRGCQMRSGFRVFDWL